jgi:hypothetical protein
MSQARFRQLARLEKLAQPHIERVNNARQKSLYIHLGAVSHAAVLSFIIRYGQPTISERLSDSWGRVTTSAAWKQTYTRFQRPLRRLGNEFKPNDGLRVLLYGDPLRHTIIRSFPGATEKEKLDRIFAAAPPWLIWFTFADYTAKLLDLTVQDLSDVRRFARSNLPHWCGFPDGAFERQPWPNGPENEPLARTDLRLLRPRIAPNLRPLPVRKPEEWPPLTSAEKLLQLPGRQNEPEAPNNEVGEVHFLSSLFPPKIVRRK